MMSLASKCGGLFASLAFCAALACANAGGPDLDGIEKQHQDKLAQAKKTYSDAVKKSAGEAIKKYEAAMRQETAAGHLEMALEIKSRIDRLKRLEADPAGELSDVDGAALLPEADEDAGNKTAILSGRNKMKSELEKRLKGFFGALIKGDYDAAKDFLDPKIVGCLPPNLIQGHFKVLSGFLMAGGIKKESQIDLKDMALGPRKNDAKVIPRLQDVNGNWHDGDPQYWILRKGVWHLGDEKELKNFK